MEKLMLPSPATDFNFGSGCSTPFASAPSSPSRLGTNFFFSAPTSPTTSAKLLHYSEFDHNSSLKDANFSHSRTSSSVPFDWEDSPGIPKNRAQNEDDERTDFEFNFSGQLDRPSLSAEELFDQGKIKPLKPPPRLQTVHYRTGSETEQSDSLRFRTANSSPRSPRRSQFFPSPRRKQTPVIDPFTKALEEARKSKVSDFNPNQISQSRGRGATPISNSHKKTRSLSPYRVADILSGDIYLQSSTHEIQTTNSTPSFWGSFSLPKAYRKWRIKDLLFRSTSEGRATEKLAVTEELERRSFVDKDVRNSSFRSTEGSTGSSSSVVGSSSRRRTRVPVSAHELHYKLNRAVSQEMRKKTSLPYKHGLLGCLGFVPGGGESVTRV